MDDDVWEVGNEKEKTLFVGIDLGTSNSGAYTIWNEFYENSQRLEYGTRRKERLKLVNIKLLSSMQVVHSSGDQNP